MENSMSTPRNYDRELDDSNCATNEKYAYSFDFDVMHPFMIRAFKPFFRTGSLLELGSYKGDFTRRFLYQFDDLTCVEASELAIKEARLRLGDKVRYVHALFEHAQLPRRFDNVVMTHVLEHIDDPVRV